MNDNALLEYVMLNTSYLSVTAFTTDNPNSGRIGQSSGRI